MAEGCPNASFSRYFGESEQMMENIGILKISDLHLIILYMEISIWLKIEDS